MYVNVFFCGFVLVVDVDMSRGAVCDIKSMNFEIWRQNYVLPGAYLSRCIAFFRYCSFKYLRNANCFSVIASVGRRVFIGFCEW